MPSSSYVVKQRLKAIIGPVFIQRSKHVYEVFFWVVPELESMKFSTRQNLVIKTTFVSVEITTEKKWNTLKSFL